MRIYGPPFYDENDWEPDEPTLKEILGTLTVRNGQVVLDQWQLMAIQHFYIEMFGRHWQSAARTFVEGVTSAANKFHEVVRHEVVRRAEPLVEAVHHMPPSNGPKYNPHARHGKGGRRR